MQDTWHIRNATPADREALSMICLKTADRGGDASALYSDPDYPALIWALPYLDFAADFAFVLEGDGEVLGYVVAAPDTRAFETRLDRDWWPKLRETYGGRTPKAPLDGTVLGIIAKPPVTPAERLADYPAHLHIDLLPAAQGGGWGRRLMETLLDALRAAGVPGVHLGVGEANARARGFYARMGFEEIGRDGAVWLGMQL
jgi:ribosomal protein S18 acetylase RimI-like enzyme